MAKKRENKCGIYAKILIEKEHNWEELIQLSEKGFKKISNLTSKENQRNKELYNARDKR